MNFQKPLYSVWDAILNRIQENMKNKDLKMKNRKFSKSQVEREIRLDAAWHEAGHFVVAQKYQLNAVCSIYPMVDTSSGNRFFSGQTSTDCSTPHHKAVIGWGGLIAEELRDRQQRHQEIPSEPDPIVYETILFMAHSISATDQQAIGKKSWRAFSTAWKIVLNNQAWIDQIARKLARNPTQPYSEFADSAIMRNRTNKRKICHA